ncbi:MAG: 16S rRNA (guanine(966)-N(2))-methyltransferase RsmD [Acidimicrobiaceae bacterium]|nr:16S rRNA (guanine(966)-N(2))-methyltransferase RsmD [Acidimicrobiaceae bacterium]
MSVRVSAGSAKGRLLAVPDRPGTRPTPGKVRQAVFNSLYSMGVVEGARVLDLFAGTGALGIEALSRGAAHAVFVERDPATADLLRGNVAVTGFTEAATVIVADASAALEGLAQRSFDVALIDPPYSFDAWSELLSQVPARLVVAESDRPVEVAPRFAVHHQRRHGTTVVTFATVAR